MSQRQSLWCGDGSFPSQTNEDVITRLTTPPEVRGGRFGISFAQQSGVGDAGGGHVHTLLSMAGSPLALEIRLEPVATITSTRGTSKVTVRAAGSLLVTSPTFTHTEGNVVDLSFDGANGRVSVERGHEEARTDTYGTPWSIADAAMTHGGKHGATGQSARGNVSLPYIVPALTPSPLTVLGEGVSFWAGGDSFTANGSDASAAENQADAGNGDLAQGTPSKQPLVVQVLGLDGFQFLKADSKGFVNATQSPPAWTTLVDYTAMWAVVRVDDTIANLDLAHIFHVNDANDSDADGALIQTRVASSGLRAQFNTVGGLKSVDHAFTDQTNLHLVMMRTEALLVASAVDGGAEVTSATTDGRMALTCDEIGLGADAAGTNPGSFTIMDAAVWHGTTALAPVKIDEMLAMFSNKYGLGLA